MKFNTLRVCMSIAISILVFSCESFEFDDKRNLLDQNGNTPVEEGFAEVSGRVVSPNQLPIPGVVVELVSDRNYTTKTDINGGYSLKIPSGPQELNIYSGSGDVFNSILPVVATPNSVLELAPFSMAPVAKFAFVRGSYDYIQNIVRDRLGYEIDSLDYYNLTDINTLNKYDVIFINCTAESLDYDNFYGDSATNALVRKNVADFVEAGGKVYVSDHGIGYLANSCISSQPAHPNTLASDHVCHQLTGVEEVVEATVEDEGLKEVIGDRATIVYDLSSWAEVNLSSDFDGEVLISDNGRPLAFSNNYGNGYVLFTTFHNEANISDDMVAILEWYIHNF